MKRPKHAPGDKTPGTSTLKKSIAILLSGIAVLLLSCENKIEQIQRFSNPENLPSITAEGFEMLYSDSSVIRFKLTTTRLVRYADEKNPHIEFPEGVHIEKFDASMKIVSSIKSNYAINYERENKWVAKNNVVAINAQSDTLFTEHLVLDEAKGKITSDEFVRIVSKDQIITGIGLETDQEFSYWEIRNSAMTVYIEMED